MALARKDVTIRFKLKDEFTGDFDKISKRFEKGLTRITTTTSRVHTELGKSIRQTQVFTQTQKTLERQLQDAQNALAGWGRKVGFTGFIISYTARRIIDSVGGMINQFLDVGRAMADTEKATGWLAETMEKLAIAGLLTQEKGAQVIGIFQRWWEVSVDLEGKLALLDITLTSIKTSIAEGINEGLADMQAKLDGIDWDTFNEQVKEAAKSLTEDLWEALEIVIGEDEEGGLTEFGSKLKSVSNFLGGFSKGVATSVNDIANLLLALDNATGKDEAGGGGAAGLGFALGRLMGILVIIGVPMMILGGAVSALSTVLGGALSGVSGLATALGMTGATGLGVVLIVVAAVLLTLILYWDDLTKVWNDTVTPALTALNDAFSMDVGGLGATLRHVLDYVLYPIKVFFTGAIVWLSTFIRLITAAKKKWDSWVNRDVSQQYVSGGTLGGNVPGASRQWGAPINKTGMYYLHKGEEVATRREAESGGGGVQEIHVHLTLDGREIARSVSRIQGRNVRSSMILV